MVHEVAIFGWKEKEEMEFKCESVTKLSVKTTPSKSVHIQYIIFPISAKDIIHTMCYIIQTVTSCSHISTVIIPEISLISHYAV